MPAPPSTNGRPTLRILLLVAVTVLFTYLFVHFDLYGFFTDRQKAIRFISTFHPFDEVVFILLQILQVVAAPIPGEATGFIGGYLYGPILGTLYSTIGLTIGSWIAFILARFLGMPLVERVVAPKVIEKFDHFMEHQGALVSFLLFLIPGFPKDYLCYIMGVSHIPTWTFLAISAAGRLFGTILLSVSGHCARNEQYIELMIMGGVFLVFALVAYFYREKWLDMLKKKGKK